MRPFLDEIAARVEAIKSSGLHRSLRDPQGLDVSSNDYLGLSGDPRLRDAVIRAAGSGPVGAPASRLLRGNTVAHRRLEGRFAGFKGTEDALLFPSGYQANLAVLTTLVKSDDLVLSDAQNHASIVDGLRLCGCRVLRFPHLDTAAVKEALASPPPRGRVFLVTESLFSMDGDIAPLDHYADLAESHGASLIVDDAHATGIFGDARGSGLTESFGVERRVAAVVSTAGKALGVAGAFVAGPAIITEYLVNKARAFIFSTAVAPVVVAAIDAALDAIQEEPDRRRRVLDLSGRLRASLQASGLDCLRSSGPIVPVILTDGARALRVAEEVRRCGFDVRAIRAPAVSPRTARLRLSVHATHAEEELDGLARAVAAAAAMFPLPSGDSPNLKPLATRDGEGGT